MKITIIGKMGAGKSTFATKLGKATGIEATHMDKIYYRRDWSHITREELVKEIERVFQRKNWIIDGNYQHTIDQRLNAADTIIYFNLPTYLCLYRAVKRAFIKNDFVKDKIEGLPNKVSWKLLKLIATYKSKENSQKIAALRKNKQIYIIKNDKDAKIVLQLITADLR
ncbi:MAG: AAA family ATPase [Patescibacteria group bacterium]